MRNARSRPPSSKRDKEIAVSVLVFITFGIVIFIFAISSQPSSPVVTSRQMRTYVSSYISEYQELYNANRGEIYASRNFSFAPTSAEAVISLTHGALMQFQYSVSSSFSFDSQTVDESVESYEWPSMPSSYIQSQLKTVEITNGNYYFGQPINNSAALLVVDPGAVLWYSGQQSGLKLSDNGSIVVYGAVIYKNIMVLKGSNSASDWSQLQAQFDALNQFVWECKGVLNATQITSIESQYEVPLMLEQIGNRMASGAYRNNANLFANDYNQLSSLADNATRQQVLNDYYNSQKTVNPTAFDQIINVLTSSWFIAISGWFLSPLITFYVLRRLKQKG